MYTERSDAGAILFPRTKCLAILSKSPNLFARFFGWFEDDDHYYLAMEYFELRDLRSCMSARKTLALPEEAVKSIARQALQALTTMHEKKITHRDLKPQNIFVSSVNGQNWTIKIGDFGISK